jgi:peptidoglycan/xylan/chitin deacetylase (PgdA/CDA1 family)
VLDCFDPLRPDEPDAARFERIVSFITSNYRVLPLAEASAALARGGLPAAAACITFDDGYADNLTVAAPILERYGAVATVFVSTGYTNGGRMWNDSVIEAVRKMPLGDVDWREFGLGTAVLSDNESRRRLIGAVLPALKPRAVAQRAAVADEIARRAGVAATQSDSMMTQAQLRAWRARGFSVGGHTVGHPILARLDDAAAFKEIAHGREQLAEWLGEAPQAFAYPNGVPGRDYGPRDVALVRRAGYVCAVSTRRAAACPNSDLYQLPRFMPWDRSMWGFGLRCARMLSVRTDDRAGLENNQEVQT